MPDFQQSALIIVDVQNDFLPGGALAVPDGNEVIAPVNILSGMGFSAVIATQDWHPADHCSFTTQDGPWPAHCIATSTGADFPSALHLRPVSHIIHKGMAQDRDSYSAFFDNDHETSTGLDHLLRGLKVSHVVVCGLALDFCVAATARDAMRCGFRTDIALEACRGITSDQAPLLHDLQTQGVGLIKNI
ncbi:isochorismatase family protein [Gluconobacter japonicus]|uniref:isochorismatase family protein n=1 Tax=Gluconobacter japonicus TaxID=376620 RepID=UPI0007847F32|nr:isochorismatase family protein [Gluconobacter japonicus]KXV25749.1 isochorismatase [Gluconobacter japonicus]